VKGYIEALRAGKPLPLPLGEIVRGAATTKDGAPEQR